MASKTTYQLDVLLGASTSPNFQSSINRAANGINSLNTTAQRVVAGITAVFATVNFSRMVDEAMSTYTEFEQEMATVTAIAQASKSEFERMEEASLAAGRSTIYTASEAASALEYMSLAGWDVNTSIEAQVPILRMAAATQKDLGTTSDLVTDSMSALGLEVGELDGYLNRLIAGNNNANTTAEQLMQALVKAGGASRTLGADLDDTITALGILANNGTKGEEAGTALNAIFTRIAANTAAMKELDNIGVSIFDDGSFIGFEESLIAINDAMADFTTEQRTQSLKNIAGVQRYSQFAYLLDAMTLDAETGTTKWQQLEEEIANSGGSLLNMYNITTDTLLNAQAVLNSAKEDMQIRIVDVFSDDAKDFTLWLANKLPEATDSIVAFAEAHSGEFAGALETVGGLIEGVWNTGVKAGSWLINHRGAVTGAITAIVTSLAAGKVMNTGKNLISVLSSLAGMGAAGWWVAGTSAIIGGVVGVINAIEQAEERAASANLDEHFGSITLTLDELDTLSRQIVGEKSLAGIVDLMDSISASADSLGRAASIYKDLQKEDWKINVGFKMTTDDYEDYASQIERYISEVESYAADKGYEVHLATSLLFGEGSISDNEISSFYAGIQEQLEGHGSELYNFLYNETNGAMLDGIIDIDEDAIVQEYLEKINNITSAITEAENSAKFDALTLQYDGTDLSGESIIKLLGDLGQYSEEVQEGARTAYESAMTSYHARKELDANYTEEDFRNDQRAAQLAYHQKAMEGATNSATYILDALEGSFPELSGAIQQYQTAPQEILDKWLDEENDTLMSLWETSPMETWGKIRSEIYEEMKNSLSDKDRAGLRKYIESMTSTMEVLEQEAAEVMKAGIELDANTKETLSHWQLINDIAFYSSGDAMNHVLDDYLVPGGQLTDFIEQNYPEMEWLIHKKKGNVTQQAQDLYDETENALNEIYAEGFDVDTEVRLHFNTPNAEYLRYIGQPSASQMIRVASNARGGIYDRPILTTFAEEGPEAAVPLDGSPRARALWVQAGEILGMYPSETRDQRLLEWANNGSASSQNTGDIYIEYNPVFTIQGNADKREVQEAVDISIDRLKEMIGDIIKEQRRVAF